jgi:outer membrane protein TolC
MLVAAATARAYASICALGEEINIAHHSVEVVKREADISETRYDAGGGSRFEVERVQLWSPRSQRPSSIARRSTQRSKSSGG